MKFNKDTQVPNIAVYAVLYAVVFGISIWLLTAHPDSPGNWFLYVGMAWLTLAGLVKFALHRRNVLRRSA